MKMKIQDLLQIPFFRECRFVSTFSFREEDILSTEDEIEDIIKFVIHDELFEIKTEESGTKYSLAPKPVTYVICKVK